MSTTQPIKDKKTLEKFKNYYLLKKNYRNHTLIILGLNTALRISDILSLKWKDVYNYSENRFRRHIFLKEQKTGKENMIAMNPSVITVLKQEMDYISLNGGFPLREHYLFSGNRSKNMPLSRYQAYRIIREAAIYTGMDEHVSCHSLRKTFGYYAWKQGVPPAVLMSIYNHSSYQVTKRYLCIEQEDRDEVFMKINI